MLSQVPVSGMGAGTFLIILVMKQFGKFKMFVVQLSAGH